jgi:outer membrane protein OmpA-like peptidoglycan-associated protein
MKKYLSFKSVCGSLAVVVLMTSCVAKKKYTEAQNNITQLQTENAQLKETGTSMQQSMATLETTNRGLQSSLDSTNTWVSGQQTRWNSFQAFYDEGMKTTEQVHQMLHTQLDNLIGAENITTTGGRIYVTLAEKTLFSSGSSKLSSKGTEVLTSLAQAIKDNPNVEIDIAATPGYYTAGDMGTMGSSTTMNNNMSNSSMNNSSMNNQNMNNQNSTNQSSTNQNSTTTNQNNTTTNQNSTNQNNNTTNRNNTTGNNTTANQNSTNQNNTATNQNSTSQNNTGTTQNNTSGNTSGNTSKLNSSGSTANRSASGSNSGAAKKSSTTRSTARTSSESKSRTYASSPSRKSSVTSSSTWSLNMARSGAIAKKLVDEGVAKSRILVNDDKTSSNGTQRDFQIVISPKSDTYYNTIGNGSTTTTPGTSNK